MRAESRKIIRGRINPMPSPPSTADKQGHLPIVDDSLLAAEFEAWERASAEALIAFEEGLENLSANAEPVA